MRAKELLINLFDPNGLGASLARWEIFMSRGDNDKIVNLVGGSREMNFFESAYYLSDVISHL